MIIEVGPNLKEVLLRMMRQVDELDEEDTLEGMDKFNDALEILMSTSSARNNNYL